MTGGPYYTGAEMVLIGVEWVLMGTLFFILEMAICKSKRNVGNLVLAVPKIIGWPFFLISGVVGFLRGLFQKIKEEKTNG